MTKANSLAADHISGVESPFGAARDAVDSERTASQPADQPVDWTRTPLAARLRILRVARSLLAARAEAIPHLVSSELSRSCADTLVAEVLPLLAAMRYLERETAAVLRTRRAAASGRPQWLGRVTSLVERVPVGRVLVIGPGNYPLFLPGVQALQALAAGNRVIWKPGRGGAAVALYLQALLQEAGLPEGALVITDESVAAVEHAIDSGVDKIVFTGSATAGRAVLRLAAERIIPCVVELSGADAVIVLPSAAIDISVRAIVFGLRLNGSATCMAPRRILLVSASAERKAAFLSALIPQIATLPPVVLPPTQQTLVLDLLAEARSRGAVVLGGDLNPATGGFTPALVLDGTPDLRVSQTDLFAPVLTVLDVEGHAGVLAAQACCPLALTASIFGNERDALRLASQLEVGHVSINDLIVPTADPRVPFSGRGQSGFGATRGAEGLLEMTVPRVVATRRGSTHRQYQPTGEPHIGLFSGLAALVYGGSLATRVHGLKQVLHSARAVSRADKRKEAGDASCR